MVGEDSTMRELRLVDQQWHKSYSVQRLGEFVTRCRNRGIPVTPQRLAVIGALLASENHPSTDEICAAVHRTPPHDNTPVMLTTAQNDQVGAGAVDTRRCSRSAHGGCRG